LYLHLGNLLIWSLREGGHFEIGDMDVTTWRGMDGVVDSGVVEYQESHRGYGVLTVYHCLLLFVVLVSPHTAILCPCVSLSEPLRVQDPSIAF
jgi:hypothetical protein